MLSLSFKLFFVVATSWMLVNQTSAQTFESMAIPFMEDYCYKCHSEDERVRGDLDLLHHSMAESLVKDREVWLDILEQVETEEMPTKKPLPSAEERAKFVEWLRGEVDSVDWSKVKYAGHVAMPRLTKREYNNTMRDLLGVDVKPGHILFEDGEGTSGFTSDRSNLFISPASMEKYFQAADKALDAVGVNHKPIDMKYEAEDFLTTSVVKSSIRVKGADAMRLTIGQTTLYDSIEVPRDGFYKINVRALSANADNGAIMVRLNNEPVGLYRYDGSNYSTQSFKTFIPKGTHQLTLNKGIEGKKVKKDRGKQKFTKEVNVDWINITGPSAVAGKSFYTLERKSRGPEEVEAKKVMSHFLLRAFRSPVDAGVVDQYMSIFRDAKEQGVSYERALRQTMLGVLISPRFLYRNELASVEDLRDEEYALDDFQIASRLSYFLWLSMPDNQLFKLAGQGKLKDPEVLRGQVARMLKDPRAREFTSVFLGQWLGFESLGNDFVPDKKLFPEFDEDLSKAMKLETILTFEHLLSRDLTIFHLLDTKATFLNERLAEHYGVKGVRGDVMRPVLLKDKFRGGLLSMASVLTSTSSPTRTSPVLRGKWVMETLLGQHIPEAPADVPEIDERAGRAKSTTLREELEVHRDNPDCARCHDRIDPIGFGLENFDAIGRFRTKEVSGQKIDSSGELNGFKFEGADELKAWLKAHRKDEFAHTVSENMLAFALGREIKDFDEGALLKITDALEASDYKISTLIEEIVLSHPFLNKSINNEINPHE